MEYLLLGSFHKIKLVLMLVLYSDNISPFVINKIVSPSRIIILVRLDIFKMH